MSPDYIIAQIRREGLTEKKVTERKKLNVFHETLFTGSGVAYN